MLVDMHTQKVHVVINGRYYQKLATFDPTIGYARLHEREGTFIPPSRGTSIWCGAQFLKPLYQGLLRSGYQLHMGDETH